MQTLTNPGKHSKNIKKKKKNRWFHTNGTAMRKATVCKVLFLFHSDRPSNDEIPGKNRTKSLKTPKCADKRTQTNDSCTYELMEE